VPGWSPTIEPIASMKKGAQVADFSKACATRFTCDAARPYCASTPQGPDSQHFWFAWEDGKLRLAGVADYEGS
jgi:hypothetical protein